MNILSNEILEFLRYRIRNDMRYSFGLLRDTFQLMLQDGMTYHTTFSCKNAIECEMNIFVNMLNILHFWDKECRLKFNDNELFCKYLRYNRHNGLNLRHVILSSETDETINGMLDLSKAAYLPRVDLRQANLSNTILVGAKLEEANLREANLTKANLRGVNLRGVNLRGADLRGAKLEGADMRGSRCGGSKNL